MNPPERCEGCGAILPRLTEAELAELPELMPPLCEECLAEERIQEQRVFRGLDP